MAVDKAFSSLYKLGRYMFWDTDISLVDARQYEEEIEVFTFESLSLSLSM